MIQTMHSLRSQMAVLQPIFSRRYGHSSRFIGARSAHFEAPVSGDNWNCRLLRAWRNMADCFHLRDSNYNLRKNANEISFALFNRWTIQAIVCTLAGTKNMLNAFMSVILWFGDNQFWTGVMQLLWLKPMLYKINYVYLTNIGLIIFTLTSFIY
jgi:hypothetical protein